MRSTRQIQETQLNMFNLNKFGLRLYVSIMYAWRVLSNNWHKLFDK